MTLVHARAPFTAYLPNHNYIVMPLALVNGIFRAHGLAIDLQHFRRKWPGSARAVGT